MSEHDPPVPPQDTPSSEPSAGEPAQPAWTPEGPSGPRASFGRRLVALLIDTILLVVVVWVLVLVAFALSDALGVIALIAALVGVLAYFIVLEGGPRGQTIGKRLVDIRVIDENTGGPIGYGRSFIRLISRYLSQLPCYLGYLWMLWDKEKQTWHDKLSSSVVVPVQYYPTP